MNSFFSVGTGMARSPLFSLLVAAMAVVASAAQPEASGSSPASAGKIELRTSPLWPSEAPLAKGSADTDRPELTVLLAPQATANGCAVVVCPGGGYWIRAMDHEGLQVAQWLNSRGIHAFILSYRTRSAGYDQAVAHLDATRAMRYVRAHAGEHQIDPQRIGMLGFSAGAHLISWVAETADAGDASSADLIEQQSSRPDFLVMVYGRASAQSKEPDAPVQPVRADTPPTFIALTHTDSVDPQSALRQLLALRQAGIEGELHVFGGDGAHGRGLHTGDPDTGVWPTLAFHWLRRNNFLTGKTRAAVEGVVTIDGVAPFMGWVTLLPVDQPNAPAASIHLSDANPKDPANGRFVITERFGPVPGRYRVEVRHQAKELGTRPSMPGERLYTKLSPNDESEIEIEVRPGVNRLELPIRSH